MSLNDMDREATIKAIRKESRDLPTNKFTSALGHFQLESYSEKYLNEMPLKKLQNLLGMIRELIRSEDS